MKISDHGLREHVALKLDTSSLASRLTLAGLEVGGISPVSAPLDDIVSGTILNVQPHPQADRLRVCEVDVGARKPLTIVCGAANAASGLRVPTALEGAVLPNGTCITRTTIRGVESSGMLCSAAELGLEEISDGLLVLDPGVKPGTPVTDVLGLDDQQLEIDLTPNRGDCLSVVGLAREIAALSGARLISPKERSIKAASRRRVKVSLSAPKSCARYAGRVIEGIDPETVTPLWMKERLRRSGIRSIHPVVDITNYVMIEMGQPMHAFDLGRLEGAVTARHARQGESLVLLDGKMLNLEPLDLVIADARGPVALAGIMGGERTAVTETTNSLFLESAWFRPEAIGPRARHYGLHSESSHRFERGVDSQMARRALDRATRLVLEFCGGRAGPVTEAESRAQLPKRAPIALRAARIERILGLSIKPGVVNSVLKHLGMRTVTIAGGWRVTPPSWRFDISREVDLIEELARVYGYDKIPVRTAMAPMRAPAIPESRVGISRVRSMMIDRDYQEAITYSFVDPSLQKEFSSGLASLDLANPISSDMAQMRTSLWPGLIHCVRYNRNRQQERIRLFEIGRRYYASDTGTVTEELMLGGVVTGAAQPKQWGLASRNVDFFDAKADIESLLALTGKSFEFRPAQSAALHPGQSAEIVDSGSNETVGKIGVLHPEIAKNIGLDCSVIIFELRMEAIQTSNIPAFHEISRFPAVTRDLAVIVDGSIPAKKVLDCVRFAAKGVLINLELFDEYRGEGIDSGRKSLALGLTFQDTSRTLNEEDVESVVGRVLEALRTEVGGQLRQ